MFPAVGGPEDTDGKKPWIEISADLVDFAGGNVAKRILIGLGSGRAHAGFSFTVKESATGKVLWKKTVKETASFWSNSHHHQVSGLSCRKRSPRVSWNS